VSNGVVPVTPERCSRSSTLTTVALSGSAEVSKLRIDSHCRSEASSPPRTVVPLSKAVPPTDEVSLYSWL
jgi:hypothetical protein